jgi:RNA polymerase sigma-70 factor (ECF subfamily)
MNLSDDLLMHRAARGNLAAFEELTVRHRDTGIRYCRRILGDYQTAEDVVQEGFVNIFNNLPRYVEKGKFRFYFFRILSNLCIDHIRHRRHIQPNQERCCEIALGGVEEEFADPCLEDPWRGLIRQEKALVLQGLLSRLPENQRKAIVLRELSGYKYQEISRALGFRINRVKVLIFRGRRNLERLAMEVPATA